MALTPIKELRRMELTHAAYEVMQQEGIPGATLEKVANHAGASKGIVLHYFENKQQLFERTMRYVNTRLRDEIVGRLKTARTPADRLLAIIEGNFAPEFFQMPMCHAWLSLCAEVPRDPQFTRIQRVIHSRMKSNLVSALKHLVEPGEIESVALGVTTLIDGLWLRGGLQISGISRREALAQMRDYLEHRVPDLDLDGRLDEGAL